MGGLSSAELQGKIEELLGEGGESEEGGGSCEPQFYTDCVGEDLFWFDSCEKKGALIAACEPGQCETGADSCCPGKVPGCYQGDIYWFDSCGVVLELKETCGGDSTCKPGETENDSPACAAPGPCEGPTYEVCHNPSSNPGALVSAGDVYLFNSCGEPLQVVETCACEEMCNNKNCIKTFWDGTWTVNLSGGCGLGSPLPYTNVIFDVSGENMNVEATVAGKQVSYTGTMDCDQIFAIEGSLTTDGLLGGEMTITESWDAQLISPVEFTGTMLETIPGIGNCVYDIQGYRD